MMSSSAFRLEEMARMADRIFATWARTYHELGCWPRPVNPGTKACKIPNWQLPDDEQKPSTLENWMRRYADHGIGLLMGSPLPDGTRLGALDVDRDQYVALARVLLVNPVCGRIGQKGAVFFVRYRGQLANPEFCVQGKQNASWGKVAECLFDKKLCVIPPTIHPKTNARYRWLGTPLHEIDFATLPLVEEK
jgi:hypothetical protein